MKNFWFIYKLSKYIKKKIKLQALKFVSLLHLSSIRRVVDILDSPDVESGVVALVYRQTEDLDKRSERCYTLQLHSESQVREMYPIVLKFLISMTRHT